MTPTACDSPERLKALTRYEILDTPPEDEFDQITRLAARICDAPIAMVNFVDRDRQWFKSETGLGLRQTGLDVSFCAHAILEPGLFIIPDTLQDERFSNNPLVFNWPHLRFYAGVSIHSSDGFALGTVCVMDYKPRGLLDPQKETLQTLAHYAMALLELRQARKAAEQSENKAGTAEHNREQFLVSASEELRRPLSPALQSVYTLLRDGSLSATQRAEVETIRLHMELETKLIDELLHFSQRTEGNAELRVEPVDVHALLNRAEQNARGREKAAPVERILRASASTVLGNGARLEQIFWNLLNRAIESTPPTGCIAVITTNPQPELLRIRIVDTGAGIDPVKLPGLFEASKAGETEATHFDGLVLHLAAMRAIIWQHRGSIAISSGGVDKGTTVTIELPTTLATEDFVRLPNEKSPPGHLRILLVEDHEMTMQTLARYLRRGGHDVETAESAARAKVLFEQREFDLLLSDLSLPDGNGLDLMRDLQARRPIEGIALTAHEMQFDIDACYTAGFRDCLTKPVDLTSLGEAVARTQAPIPSAEPNEP